MKKAVIIPASYKGTLTSIEVGDIMAKAIKKVAPNCQTIKIPISDGGEGCVDCFIGAFGGTKVTLKTFGPYEKPMDSFYGRLPDGTAVIEMAASAGLPLVKDNPNPALTTTFGVGQLIKHAVQHGSKKIIIGLGGSCTNDAGVGLASALGVEFFNHACKEFLPTGGTLSEIHFISTDHLMPEIKSVKFTVLCDVKNTLTGPTGAAYVFARQKGANEAMIKSLDENLVAFSTLLKAKYDFDTDFEGAGAAGGTTICLKLFMNANIKKGIDTILDMINFDHLI
ncbi:MAG: glycerate kinase, partial [Firmicutes bacterium]|nr:glycerate kinase [Bacillota bacterium]